MDKREKQINFLKHLVWVVMTLVGTFIMAVGYSVFLVPNNIVAGGFSGLAFLITEIIADIFGNSPISKGVLYIIMNIPLFLLGWKSLGKSFSFLALIGTLSFSFFMDMVKFDIVVQDTLLSALFGGILYGIGLGIVVRGNSSTGGTDMLGNILHNKNYKITVGGCVIAIDFCVIAISALYIEVLTALYGLVAIFISGLICDYITEGPRAIKAYYIISDKYEEISESIICEIHRGVTGIDVEGMFSQNKRKMLLVLISRRQIDEMNRIVFSIDPDAFTFTTNCKDAIGNGFNKPLMPRKKSDIYRLLSGDKMDKVEKVNLPKYQLNKQNLSEKTDEKDNNSSDSFTNTK